MKKIEESIAKYIISELSKVGVKTYFGVQGGACAHLIHAAASNTSTKYIPVLNEQTAGLYAHGAYMSSGEVCGIIVTTGPGFFNAVTGIAACYFDHVPIVVLCGQMNAAGNLATNFGTKMYGFQEADHAEMAKTISSKVIRVKDRASLTQALSLIRSLKTIDGPLFLEIQDDLQRKLSKDFLGEFDGIEKSEVQISPKEAPKKIMEIINQSLKPLMLIGAGVNQKDFAEYNDISKKHNIPIIFSWGGQKYNQYSNKLHQGIFGNHSPGRANDLIKEADLIIAVGISLLQHQVGKDHKKFAPLAKILFINNNHNECSRFKSEFGLRAFPLNIDAKILIDFLISIKLKNKIWIGKYWKSQDKQAHNLTHINEAVKCLMMVLEKSPKNSAIFSDAGATLSWTYQAANLVKTPPIYTSFNLHTMGYAVPASNGASYVNSEKLIISISGDGGFMMNLQELAQTNGRKIKTIILDNDGYGIIRQTQDEYLSGDHFGSSMNNKISPLPRYNAYELIKAFGIPTQTCTLLTLEKSIKWLFSTNESSGLVIKIGKELKVQGVGI